MVDMKITSTRAPLMHKAVKAFYHTRRASKDPEVTGLLADVQAEFDLLHIAGAVVPDEFLPTLQDMICDYIGVTRPVRGGFGYDVAPADEWPAEHSTIRPLIDEPDIRGYLTHFECVGVMKWLEFHALPLTADFGYIKLPLTADFGYIKFLTVLRGLLDLAVSREGGLLISDEPFRLVP